VSAWHTVVDSDPFRALAKRGPGRALLRSRAFGELDLARKRVQTSHRSRRARESFDEVATFCCFVGHNKSGSSMTSALLDAHPEIVLSDEVDLLRYVEHGFQREQLFRLAARGARAEARKGRVTARRLEPYSYAVPGASQGLALRPRVVGDSTTGTSTRRLGADPYLWDRVHAVTYPVAPKLVHVIRNPFDPISVMMVRGHRSFANSVDHYFTACATLETLRGNISPADLHDVRYEDMVADPRSELRSLCAFLGVDAGNAYLDACAAIVRPDAEPSRHMVEWTRPWIDAVQARLADHDFLQGYSYDR
jgi:Sulfotransferase family